jgi:hypothetical protein
MGGSLPSQMISAHCFALEIGLEKHALNGKFRRACAVRRAWNPSQRCHQQCVFLLQQSNMPVLAALFSCFKHSHEFKHS